MDYEKRVQAAVREIVASGCVESAHDLSDGGLAVALAESSFGPSGTGAEVSVESNLRPDMLWFHEAPSRILLAASDIQKVQEIADNHGVPAPQIGVTIKGQLRLRHGSETWLDSDLNSLKQQWADALERQLQA